MSMIWFAVNFTENVEKSYVDGKHKHTVDAKTATAVGKLLRASIIITGVLMLLWVFYFRRAGAGWRRRDCYWLAAVACWPISLAR